MPDAEFKDTKVIMIMGISKAARASTLKMVERGNTVVLVANPEHQEYLDALGTEITALGGQSLAMGIDCSSLLEVETNKRSGGGRMWRSEAPPFLIIFL